MWPEALANDLFSGWDMAREGRPWSGFIEKSALLGLDLTTVHQRVWQHILLNALLIRWDGLTFLLLPQTGRDLLTSLPALPWPSAEAMGSAAYGALLAEVVSETVWRGLTPRGAPVDWSRSTLLPLDFAPLVGRQLASLVDAEGAPEQLTDAIGLLELLLRFRGGGSEELLCAPARLRAREIAAVIEAQQSWSDDGRGAALAALGRWDDGRLGRSQVDGGTRVAALSFRHSGLDGSSGGWVGTLCELELRVEPTGVWRLARRVVWEDREEGTELGGAR